MHNRSQDLPIKPIARNVFTLKHSLEVKESKGSSQDSCFILLSFFSFSLFSDFGVFKVNFHFFSSHFSLWSQNLPRNIMSFIATRIDNFEEGNQDKQESDSCRVCMESSEETSQLIKPCNCKGSVEFIHFHCLKEWMDYSHDDDVCEICKTKYHGLVKTVSGVSDAVVPVNVDHAVYSTAILFYVTMSLVIQLTWPLFACLNGDYGFEAKTLAVITIVVVFVGYGYGLLFFYYYEIHDAAHKKFNVSGFDDTITRTSIQRQSNQSPKRKESAVIKYKID